MFTRFRTLIHELIANRAVLYQLTRQQLILRYRRTMLGYFWTLINPLMMMTVTAVVFSNLFKADLKTFAIFMFAGMIPWNCFAGMIAQSTASFINNEGLIKKIYLPKAMFPLSIAIAVVIDSGLSLIALFLIIFALGGEVSWALLFLPLAYVLLFFFTLGISLVMSLITVFFRDLQHVIVIALQALFFLSPVIYEKKAFEGKLAWILQLNPMSTFIELFRDPIRHGMLPPMPVMAQALIFAVVSMVVGLAIFLRNEKKIVFRL